MGLFVAPALGQLGDRRAVPALQEAAEERLAVVFTVRGARVRVISARPLSQKERRVYAQARSESDS